jgi:hypothetical protein
MAKTTETREEPAGTQQEAARGTNQAQAEPKISSKVPKLTKKNKSRLPRREKKARQKAGAV